MNSYCQSDHVHEHRGGAIRILTISQSTGAYVLRGRQAALIGQVKLASPPAATNAGGDGVLHDGRGHRRQSGIGHRAIAITISGALKDVFYRSIFQPDAINKFTAPVQRNVVL
jgi:hypothetical protein